jgi:manganese/zinc/iron transport system permease protein
MNPLDILSDYTLRNVVIGAVLLGIGSGVLGCYAVLRKESLVGDTLSHAALPGICLGFLLSGSRQLFPLLSGALVSGAVAVLFMLLLTTRSRLKTDAALGIALSVFFAVGTVLLTYIQGQRRASQAGLDRFLFGQAAAILHSDLLIIAAVTAAALLLILSLWKELQVVTFDPGFARSLGLPTIRLELLLTLLIALAVVIGLQMVGVILMAAMIIAPAVAARQWVRRLSSMVILAALFGALSGVVGALISAQERGLATGPLIIVCASGIVAMSLFIAPGRGLLWQSVTTARRKHQFQQQQIVTNLFQLGNIHNDPNYQVEEGMLRSLYGHKVSRQLRDLKRAGLITTTTHMPEEGRHWQLTQTGQSEARRILHHLNHSPKDT